MIWDIIPLVGSYFSSGMANYWFLSVLILAFLATVPVILRSIVRWR